MKPLLVAAVFLTRLPVPIEATAADVRAAMRWFPAVGAALGTVAAVASLALSRLDVPPLLSATLLIAAGAWVTGAIHLDGVADMADGFGGGRTKDDALRIMRDPRVGSFGAVALIVVLGLKVAALTALIERRIDASALITAPTLSRWTVVALGRWLPYARPEGGLGLAATESHDPAGFLIATIIAAAVSIAAAGIGALALWVSMLAVVGLVGRAAARHIGGVTGDVFGATVELAEAVMLITAVLLSSRG
jgi:cobalamin 5'-phosphate synthase/cobalamin synthase